MSGTGIFRKVQNPNGFSNDDFYITEELSLKDKEFIDKMNASALSVEWKVEETCVQELYSDILFNQHYELTHKGHEYLITFDSDGNGKQIWVAYDRDLSDPKYAYNAVWETEPRADFSDLPSLIFGFKLQNDGRTIAEYCCDFWKQPRILVPEPVDKNLVGKAWRH